MASRQGPDKGDSQRADAESRFADADLGCGLDGGGSSLGEGAFELGGPSCVALQSDFYADDAEGPSRSATISELLTNFDDFPPSSDYYAHKQDVHRGLTLSALDLGEDGLLFDSCSGPASPGLDTDTDLAAPESPLSALSGSMFMKPVDIGDGQPRFQENDTPPLTPADGFFTFMVTTLFVSGISAARIGNLLLEYLLATSLAQFEVRPESFSIKANVKVDEELCCLLKIRLYRQESDEFAVEFRRCRGDSVVFSTCFQQAREKLLTCGGAVVRV